MDNYYTQIDGEKVNLMHQDAMSHLIIKVCFVMRLAQVNLAGQVRMFPVS